MKDGTKFGFDHAGNVAIALVAGAVGYAFSQRAVFLLVPVFTVLAGAAAHPKRATAMTAMMSACIVAAQLVMLPIALLVGRTANTWGRKPLFLAGFAILPIRAVLYTLSDNSFWLIGVQVLDGVGAGIPPHTSNF